MEFYNKFVKINFNGYEKISTHFSNVLVYVW